MSLLGQRFQGTDKEAVATVRDASPRFRFLVTPWPNQQIVEGVLLFAVGIWGAIEVGSSNLLAGLGVLVGVTLLAAFIAGPGIYTVRHRDQAARFYGASRVRGDLQAGAHPVLVTIGYVVACALAGAFLGHGHQTTTAREAGAAAGAVFGLVVAMARVRRGRRHLHTS